MMPAPIEHDGPALLNGLLDSLETVIQLVIDHGGEAALRHRLARLLPAQPRDALEASIILTALKAADHRKLACDTRDAIARAKQIVLREMHHAS